MSTLKELLKDRTLPVRVKHRHWDAPEWLEIHYTHGADAYGHTLIGVPFRASLTDEHWSLFEPLKPRLMAWRFRVRGETYGSICLLSEHESEDVSKLTDFWKRCPWLDENGCKLRGAGAKNKRRKKRYQQLLSMKKEAKDVLKSCGIDA